MRVFQTLLAFSGNAPPQLAITRQLVERGHEVRVLAHRAARERVESTGAEFVAFKQTLPDMDFTRRESDSLRDWEARTKLGRSLRVRNNILFNPLIDTTRECAEQLESWPADAMVFDWMQPGAPIAAEGADLPAVAIVHGPYPLPVEGAPPLGSGWRPLDGRLGAARDRLAGRIVARFFAPGLPILNRARSEQGLEPLASWDAQLLRAQTIYVMSAPELDFSSRAALPANVRYVGPAFEPFAREWVSPWPETNTAPLVLISLSTSYMNQQALAQRILDAVGALPVRALLTAGPALDTRMLRIPTNTHTVAYLPHRTVLPHTALVVTHAGWQTINAALADGVPLLCIPDGRDQPDNAARVVLVGAGMRVRKGASPRRVQRAIEAALEDPSLKRGASAMAAALARSDGALTVAEDLERLLEPDAGVVQPGHFDYLVEEPPADGGHASTVKDLDQDVYG
ncbi:MAG: glycosyltransferase [Solirubrobacterales bacterium]